MLITVPGMSMSLQTLGTQHFTTGWKHAQRFCATMVLQSESQGVTKVLESVRRMSRWWILLIASRGKLFQNLTYATSRCCLSGIRTLRWSATIPEDTQLPQSRFASLLNNDIHVVLSVGSQSKRLGAFCNLLKRAEAVTIKEVRKREILGKNAQLKQLIQKRNKLRRDLRANRKQWRETNRKIIRLT